MVQDVLRLVVLIDANNIDAAIVKELLEKIAKYGVVAAKRSYGDWTMRNPVGWKGHLHRHATQPMRQFAYTKGGNNTDSACITDAMDLLCGGDVDGFCLASSDSDFIRPTTRLREAGKAVYGFGECKTPDASIVACDKFVFVEVLRQPVTDVDPGLPVQVKDTPPLHGLLSHAVRETQCDMDWSSLLAAGSFTNKNHAPFSPRSYGFSKPGDPVRK